MITISAFAWVPDFAQGLVRDLRARWALEEAGLPYRTRLLEQIAPLLKLVRQQKELKATPAEGGVHGEVQGVPR